MLTLTALVKQFGTNRAVDGLSLSVGKGEVFGLLGPNGAGKSTTVHMAVGLVEPTSGQVDVGGLGSPRQPAVRARIGVAPQALSLYELLTAEENLTFFGRVYGMEAARARRARHLGARVRRPRRPPPRSGRHLLGRHEAAAEPGRGDPARSRSRAARRADGRRRSPVAQRHLRQPAGAEGGGQDHRLHDALHGGGRAPLRSRGHHRSRQAARRSTPCTASSRRTAVRRR